jgi:hypothetical protein
VVLPHANGECGLAAGDLNGDGLADIVANDGACANLLVFLSQGDGGFQSTAYGTPSVSEILLLPRAGKPPDLLLALSGLPIDAAFFVDLGVGVMHNLGDGTFSDAQTIAAQGGSSLAIGDFNGDCIPDVATPARNFYGCEAGWGTSVLYADGDGGFARSQQFLPAAGQGPMSVAVLGSVQHPGVIAVSDSCTGDIMVYGGSSGH